MDWYKHDIGAFRRKTHGLTALEEGIYRRLLDEYYASGGPLPNDLPTLKSLAKIRSKWEVNGLSKVVSTFFEKNGDGLLHNRRADDELADYNEICKTNRRIAQQRTVQRSVERSVTETSTNTDRHTNNRYDAQLCCFHINGNPCGQPITFWNRNGSKGHCAEHGPCS